MAAKTWETDFRYAAIRESVRVLNETPDDDLFSYPGSLCVPVAKKPVVGWTPGRIFLVCLALGFALLVSAFVLIRGNEHDWRMGAICISLVIAGISLFFLPLMLDRFIMRLLIGARGAELVERPGKLLCAEISDTDRSKMKISIDGGDYVLLLADEADHRLLIEGVAARYVIRAQDVTQLKPFRFMNYVGAEMTFRISDQVALSIAIARVSWLLELIWQSPFLFFLRGRIKNRILSTCQQALAVSYPGRATAHDEHTR